MWFAYLVLKEFSVSLTEISSDEQSFKQAAPLYQQALDKCGYKQKLTFKHPSIQTNNKDSRRRKRNITWYNPPFSENVATNVGQSFLRIIDEEFPSKHPLHKIFNRNTVKVSYSCMPNVKQIIDGHNKSKLSKSCTTHNETTCNCQKKNECPLSNKCTTQSVVYQATVTTISKTFDKPLQTYIGLTENSFKTRYANHKASFNSYNKRNSTELSKFVWELKSNKIDYKIKWKILRRARPYNPASNRSNWHHHADIIRNFF